MSNLEDHLLGNKSQPHECRDRQRLTAFFFLDSLHDVLGVTGLCSCAGTFPTAFAHVPHHAGSVGLIASGRLQMVIIRSLWFFNTPHACYMVARNAVELVLRDTHTCVSVAV